MTVPEQAVEAAAKALYAHEFARGSCEFPAWEHETIREGLRDRFRERARAALTAALPLVGVMRWEDVARATMKVDGLSPENIAFDEQHGLPTWVKALAYADAVLALPAQSGSGVREDVARAVEEAREFVRNLWRNNALREREAQGLIALIDAAEKLALAKPAGQPVEGDADLRHAQRLATVLWEKHWKADAPNWKVGDNLSLVIDQIDNMVAGLSPASPQPQEGAIECRSTKAMRDRARELATPIRDDFDRAVHCVLDDFDTLQAALHAILADPHGCAFCDSGKLRNPAKPHDPTCGYALAAVIAEKQTGAK